MSATWEHIEPGDWVEFETHMDSEPPRIAGEVISKWRDGGVVSQLDIRDGKGKVWVRRASDVIILGRRS